MASSASSASVPSPPNPHPVQRVKRVRKKCPHDKRFENCKTCGGASFCQHGKLRQNCKACGGSGFCEHGLRRHNCRACGGSSICEHGKQRPQCKACNGSGICEHGKQRRNCRECGGASFCEHQKRRTACAECQNLPCTIEGCPQFGHRFCHASKLLQHMRSKHSGEPKALTKTKELSVYKALQEANIGFEYQKHLPFHGCDLNSETKCAFVDFAITTSWGVILLEVDENMHAGQPSSCDVRRDFDMCASIILGSQHKVVVLRYNPDSFRIDRKM